MQEQPTQPPPTPPAPPGLPRPLPRRLAVEKQVLGMQASCLRAAGAGGTAGGERMLQTPGLHQELVSGQKVGGKPSEMGWSVLGGYGDMALARSGLP